jgi:hypothetical protein
MDSDSAATVPEVLTDHERAAAERIFRAHGYDEPLRIATLIGDDERVFVI